ncbi:MAG: DUF1211 domain-containing protein [Thermoplasmata archaeon]|nr:DUF1211 domain-containing protein [Thermoplasmata archaeon]
MAGDDLAGSPTGPWMPHRPGQESRGEDLSRIIALTDGVFAFALTLLALSLVVPDLTTVGLTPSQVSGHLGYALWKEYPTFTGYVFVFVMIAVWWVGHHRLFRYIVRYDDVLIVLNLVLLLEIAVMPFVLRIYASFSDTQVAVILFALIQIATGLTVSLLWLYASWRHRLIARDVPEATVRYFRQRFLLTPIVFAISIGVSFVSVLAAELVWVGAIGTQWLTRYSYSVLARKSVPHPPR